MFCYSVQRASSASNWKTSWLPPINFVYRLPNSHKPQCNWMWVGGSVHVGHVCFEWLMSTKQMFGRLMKCVEFLIMWFSLSPRYELRVRYLPKNFSDLYLRDKVTFFYLYDQVTVMFVFISFSSKFLWNTEHKKLFIAKICLHVPSFLLGIRDHPWEYDNLYNTSDD